MAKKLVNAIYNGVFEGMTIDDANTLFEKARSSYQPELDRFNKLYDLYKKPDSNGEYDKNIIFELIESEVDNNIYYPKVRSMNGRTGPSIELEKILRSELYDYNYREFNDIQERFTYIFGGAVSMVYWDPLSRNSARGGKLRYKSIDPRCFIPQAGVNTIEDMDYCFIVESCTKMKIQNLYQLETSDLDFLKSDTEWNIDPDLITVKTMFYKDKYNHVCKFVWSGSLVLEDDDNIYSDKLLHCTKCGAVKQADEDDRIT